MEKYNQMVIRNTYLLDTHEIDLDKITMMDCILSNHDTDGEEIWSIRLWFVGSSEPQYFDGPKDIIDTKYSLISSAWKDRELAAYFSNTPIR